MVKRALVSRFGSKYIHLLKLLGSLVVLIGLLQLVLSIIHMSDAWTVVKTFEQCAPQDSEACAAMLYRMTGLSVWAEQTQLFPGQVVTVILQPAAEFLWWLAVVVFGMLLFNIGKWLPFDLQHRNK